MYSYIYATQKKRFTACNKLAKCNPIVNQTENLKPTTIKHIFFLFHQQKISNQPRSYRYIFFFHQEI